MITVTDTHEKFTSYVSSSMSSFLEGMDIFVL